MAPSRPGRATSRFLPFSPSTTPLQAATYLLGISLFSISFLVFLNSAVSFVITDLLGVKRGVGDIVGTLGFADELVALVACPLWGLLSDRLGVRWVAVLGYTVIAASLVVFVQCRNVYPALILARIMFAVGATAAATMVTATLPVLTGDDDADDDADTGGVRGGILQSEPGHERAELDAGDPSSHGNGNAISRTKVHAPRNSIAFSLESDATITPARFLSESQGIDPARPFDDTKGRKPSALAGFVGLFTGCGALVALVLFLPLPAQFLKKDGVTPAQAITDSFYVVAAVALVVAFFVFFGLRGLKGEENKGWRMLLALKERDPSSPSPLGDIAAPAKPLPYHQLLLSSLRLGATDPHIALGYLGGFVARASTVAISLFLPLYINTYFMSHGFCQGSPNDPSPDLKRECRAAYVLSASLSGGAQLVALLCAPIFGYVNARRFRGVNLGLPVATALGAVGYIMFPRLASPEFKDIDGRGGSPAVFLVVALLGISQIGAIVCSLGSLGRGILGEDVLVGSSPPDASEESEALLADANGRRKHGSRVSRVQLKGSVAGVYSWCGGAAILLLTKLGGYFFDVLSTGAPFYMMAIFNVVLFVASLGIDLGRIVRDRNRL
ncbi:hypothetical protein F4808DRAFT_422522 [Astrocystis sublimbata]|nr:hypothetical protein F4808DRAFT_422522 [Astrocystis sublimbata]